MEIPMIICFIVSRKRFIVKASKVFQRKKYREKKHSSKLTKDTELIKEKGANLLNITWQSTMKTQYQELHNF